MWADTPKLGCVYSHPHLLWKDSKKVPTRSAYESTIVMQQSFFSWCLGQNVRGSGLKPCHHGSKAQEHVRCNLILLLCLQTTSVGSQYGHCVRRELSFFPRVSSAVNRPPRMGILFCVCFVCFFPKRAVQEIQKGLYPLRMRFQRDTVRFRVQSIQLGCCTLCLLVCLQLVTKRQRSSLR